MKRCLIVNSGTEQPSWVEPTVCKLSKCWRSAGGITVMVECHKNHWLLVCCPSLRELVGGKNDGRNIYASFRTNIGKIVHIFDEIPRIVFDSARRNAYPFVMFVGVIEGEKVRLVIVGGPTPGQPTAELAYTKGPKKGRVEPCLPKQEDGDVAGSE